MLHLNHYTIHLHYYYRPTYNNASYRDNFDMGYYVEMSMHFRCYERCSSYGHRLFVCYHTFFLVDLMKYNNIELQHQMKHRMLRIPSDEI